MSADNGFAYRLRELSDLDQGWLVGLLEGEGCFTWAPLRGGSDRKIPLVQLIMNDLDVVERYATIVENSIGIKKRKPPRNNGYRVRTAGARAVVLMEFIHPNLGARRSERVAEILEEYYGQAGVEAAARKKG